MKTYITQEYDAEFAPVNSLWAAGRQHGFVPDRVHFLTPDPEGARAARIVRMLEIVQDALGKTPDVHVERVDPEDLKGTRETVQRIVTARKMEGGDVAVDVTPGRTLPKLALFQVCDPRVSGGKHPRPDRVFYLSVTGYDYRPHPYVLVPFRIQRSLDLASEVSVSE